MVRRSVPRNRGIQQVGDVRLFWSLWIVRICSVQHPICPGWCPVGAIGQESVPHQNVTSSTYLYLSTSPIPYLYVHYESQTWMNPPQIVDPEDKTRRTDLELPEVTLSQPHKHGAFLLFHPQLVILLQLLSLALAIECGDQGIMIVWSA
jgi:hypothetical protein